MNTQRILLGGLVGGLVMVVIDGFANAVIFGPAWAAAYETLGLPPENPAVPAYWISFDVLAGVIMAWLYAAMLPRFGPRVRTAIYVGLVESSGLATELGLDTSSEVPPTGFKVRMFLGVRTVGKR